jgi:DNA ligase-associated metallophosphoesterase
MNAYTFSLADAALIALPSGGLHWPAENLLCVSDLHLGKSERLARRGGTLLPPYETRETLTRLDADLAATDAVRVVCLGDSFDDNAAGDNLPEEEMLWLTRMMAGRDWTWIAGNHDPAPPSLGGSLRGELRSSGLTFRHIAQPGAFGEVSGHYHPKASIAGRSRPCFLIDQTRVILPAYGAYTGGMRADHPMLTALMGKGGLSVLTGPQCLAVPIDR